MQAIEEEKQEEGEGQAEQQQNPVSETIQKGGEKKTFLRRHES